MWGCVGVGGWVVLGGWWWGGRGGGGRDLRGCLRDVALYCKHSKTIKASVLLSAMSALSSFFEL